MTLIFDVALQFTPYPGGRYKSHGPGSAEALVDLLLPTLVSGQTLALDFDGLAGLPGSFLHGLIWGLAEAGQSLGLGPEEVFTRITAISNDRPVFALEFQRYKDMILADLARKA